MYVRNMVFLLNLEIFIIIGYHHACLFIILTLKKPKFFLKIVNYILYGLNIDSKEKKNSYNLVGAVD